VTILYIVRYLPTKLPVLLEIDAIM